MNLTFAAYTIGAGAFWGSFFLVFFMGTGFIAIPFENMVAFMDRPRPVKDAEQFKSYKDKLAKNIDYLLKEGKKIYSKKQAYDRKMEGAGVIKNIANYKETR